MRKQSFTCSPSSPSLAALRVAAIPLVLLSHVKPTTSTSFPTKLPPPSIWGSADSPTLTARYGYALSDLPARLKGEMLALEKVATDPQPNLLREETRAQVSVALRHTCTCACLPQQCTA